MERGKNSLGFREGNKKGKNNLAIRNQNLIQVDHQKFVRAERSNENICMEVK